jgi:hypothetical protein
MFPFLIKMFDMQIFYYFYKCKSIVYTHSECHEKCWRSKLYDHCKNIFSNWSKYPRNVFIQLNSQYTKSIFNILFKFTLVDTSLVAKIWFDSFLFQIQIHAKDKLKWINICIVLKLYVCYMIWIFLLTFINSTWVIFWYEDWKVGLACPKNNVGRLYSFKCSSQNIPRGQKPSLGASDNDFELSSTICSKI